MYKKIISFFSITLILFSSASNLLAVSPHNCKLEAQKSEGHCEIPMQKMDCCPAEQQNNVCTCPEMNDQNNPPAGTAPVVLNSPVNYPGVDIAFQYILFDPYSESQKQYVASKNIYKPLNHIKIYKTVQSFLI